MGLYFPGNAFNPVFKICITFESFRLLDKHPHKIIGLLICLVTGI